MRSKAAGAENKNRIRYFEIADHAFRQVSRFSRWLNICGLSIFLLMMCLTFADVILRYVFSRPIMGSKVYTEVMLVMLIAFTIPYTYERQGHIGIEILTHLLNGKRKKILEIIVGLISVGLFVVVVWRCVAQLLFFLDMGHMHGTAVQIPAAPFQAAMVVGTSTLLLLIIRNTLNHIAEGIRFRFSISSWFIIFGSAIVLFAAAYIWMQPDKIRIGLSSLAVIGLLLMLVLMFTGLPISFSLILAGFLMIGHIRGTTTAFNVVGTEIFSTCTNYLWSVAAFFILMGHFCLFSRFGEEIYITFNKWFGHMRGGLAIGTVIASTALAGIVGDALSVTTTMGTIAYPEMKKYKYSDALSTGTIAAGATLGPLIPPSLGFIIYGTITGVSIGKLFIAGIIPGLLLAFLFIAAIVLHCRINRNAGPQGQQSSWKDKLSSSRYGAPIIALFLLVIGGIYAGVFTATEGGAIGCVGALVLGLIMRRLTFEGFVRSLFLTGRIIGMIFLIIIGAMIFSRFIAWCKLSEILLALIGSFHLPPKILILCILIIFFILGFFLDIIPMLLIGVPICHPVAVALGADPVWFAVLFVLVIQAGVITPPFATILFALKGVVQEVDMGTIFIGIMPFVIATVIGVIIMFLEPAVVTWLPGVLF